MLFVGNENFDLPSSLCGYVSIFAGKFLPFKTPLDERYDSMVPEANRFNIPMLMTSMKTYKVGYEEIR